MSGEPINGVECLHCNTRIVSTHRHDFRGCPCPETTRVYVDGGTDYKRRAWSDGARWRDLASGLIFPDTWQAADAEVTQ